MLPVVLSGIACSNYIMVGDLQGFLVCPLSPVVTDDPTWTSISMATQLRIKNETCRCRYCEYTVMNNG